jgi:hypothetical protein
METEKALQQLGVGLSRLLRYSFGGFLLIVLSALVNREQTGHILKAIPWQLTALAAVVVGAGLYAAHRSLVIPLHHLGLCFILFVCERWRNIPRADSTSPTRWLGHIGVPRFRRITAYMMLRSDFFSEEERETLNVAHAENGLVVMLAEGFAAAAVYAMSYPTESVSSRPLWVLCLLFLLASYPRAVLQHQSECMRLRSRERGVLANL